MLNRIIIIITFIIIPVTLFSEDFTIHLKDCAVNWTKGVIISKGSSSIKVNEKGLPVLNSKKYGSINNARMFNYMVARERALNNLINSMKHIRVDPDNLLIDIIRKDKSFQMNFSRLVINSIKCPWNYSKILFSII